MENVLGTNNRGHLENLEILQVGDVNERGRTCIGLLVKTHNKGGWLRRSQEHQRRQESKNLQFKEQD